MQRRRGIRDDLLQKTRQTRSVVTETLRRVEFGVTVQFEIGMQVNPAVAQGDREIVDSHRTREALQAGPQPGEGVRWTNADGGAEIVSCILGEAQVPAKVLIAITLVTQQPLERNTRRAQQVERRGSRLELELQRQDGRGYTGNVALLVQPAGHRPLDRYYPRAAKAMEINRDGDAENIG